MERTGLSLAAIINECKNRGVGQLMTVCTDAAEIGELQDIVNAYAGICMSVGVHPSNEVSAGVKVSDLEPYCADSKVRAIGETGLDYYYDHIDRAEQVAKFSAHLELAHKVKLPLIIHSRSARKETIEMLRDYNARDIGGVLHCFTENWEMAKQGLDLGFYISFSGIVTFKNANELREVALKVPLDRMLVETDAPYLAPVPVRGKDNQPANVSYVAQFLADLRGVDYEELVAQTTANAQNLYQWQECLA